MTSELDLNGTGMTSQRTRSRLVERLREQGIKNEHILDIIREVPRHAFVDEALAHRAYEDTALPIGFKQTISQPYIVAKMTEALFADTPSRAYLKLVLALATRRRCCRGLYQRYTRLSVSVGC